MATVVELSDEMQARLARVMERHGYPSVEAVLDDSLRVFEQESGGAEFQFVEVDTLTREDVSEEDWEAIQEGLADFEAGRTIPAKQVFDELLEELKQLQQQRER